MAGENSLANGDKMKESNANGAENFLSWWAGFQILLLIAKNSKGIPNTGRAEAKCTICLDFLANFNSFQPSASPLLRLFRRPC